MTLTELEKGTIAQVTDVQGNRELTAKINAIGISKNHKVRILRKGPLGGPLMIEVVANGGKVIVAENLARNIKVEVIPND